MSRITQKLKSEGGASLIIALIFFLTAFMVGTVVLSSATANSDKLIARREERQRYFALSSAARFLRTTIEGTKVEAWKETTNYFCRDTVNIKIIEEDGNKKHSDKTTHSDEMTITSSEKKIQALLAETAYEMYKINEKLTTDTKPPSMKEFTIKVSNMEPVKVTPTMSNDYTLSLLLKIEATGETMNMEVKASIDPVKEDKEETHEHRCNETYKDENNHDQVKEVNLPFKIEIKRLITKVTWGTATISKGVVAP